jgi:hypothetical protein
MNAMVCDICGRMERGDEMALRYWASLRPVGALPIGNGTSYRKPSLLRDFCWECGVNVERAIRDLAGDA